MGRMSRTSSQPTCLDGTAIEDLCSTEMMPWALALDMADSKIYFSMSRSYDASIVRADFDGSNVEVLLNTGAASIRGLELDLIHGKMYWTQLHHGVDKIVRANLDGTHVENLVEDPVFLADLALDVPENRMYWTVPPSGSHSPVIQRANLDGSKLQTIVTQGLFVPYGIEILHVPKPVLSRLEIVGPNEVAENFSVGYKAIAHYESGSTKDVTDSADWQVEPNMLASIEAGLLTTEGIDWPEEDITIYAQYTEDEVSVEAEKAVTVFAVCPTGTALSFDGVNDYVNCGNDDSLDITDAMTISTWVKPSGSIAVTPHRFIGRGYYNNSSDAKYIILFYNYELNEFGYKIRHDKNPKLITCPGVKGAWQHIVATYDSGTMKLYINGEYAAGTTGADLQSDISNYNLTIGAGISQTLSFNGVIDEVAIYNRALSAEEIRANMHTRLSGDEPGLVGYWDFDEGEEQVAYDLSPYGNHGQLGSTPDADASDPGWVESDAPMGICTQEELVERNLSDVLDIKLDILEQLGIALAKEEAVVDMLKTFFKNRDFGNAKKGNIGKAKKKIHSAIKHEKKSKKELEKSIEKLEDALTTLGQ